MNKKLKFALVAVAIIGGFVALGVWLLNGVDVAVLNPKGPIAEKQRNLLVFACALSLIIIIPVFTLLFYISWKYREGNTKAKYRPDWDTNHLLEAIWWGIPCVLILVLAIVTWRSSHDLDPYKPLNSSAKAINVQVVALQWKWLFIYPEQQIASVNLVQFPVGTPVNFTITADAPMNSFWIPSLGGQIYAMSGMSTKLHLQADKIGDYPGSSANISGEGFADMKLVARASSQEDFEKWVANARFYGKVLDFDAYNRLAEPSTHAKPLTFALSSNRLYDNIIAKYMAPHGEHHEDNNAAIYTPLMEGM